MVRRLREGGRDGEPLRLHPLAPRLPPQGPHGRHRVRRPGVCTHPSIHSSRQSRSFLFSPPTISPPTSATRQPNTKTGGRRHRGALLLGPARAGDPAAAGDEGGRAARGDGAARGGSGGHGGGLPCLQGPRCGVCGVCVFLLVGWLDGWMDGCMHACMHAWIGRSGNMSFLPCLTARFSHPSHATKTPTTARTQTRRTRRSCCCTRGGSSTSPTSTRPCARSRRPTTSPRASSTSWRTRQVRSNHWLVGRLTGWSVAWFGGCALRRIPWTLADG